MSAAPRDARAFFLDPGRRPALGLGLGAGALVLALLLGGRQGLAVAYLPAWLCLLALPAGALPLVIMFERADAWRPQPETALLETLRGLLPLMPVAGLLGLPLLLALPDLYPWAQDLWAQAPQAQARSEGRAPTALAALWFTPPFFAVRFVLYVTAWTGLARLFARRGGEPWGKAGRIDDGRAVLGLGLHLVVGTLAAEDLVASVSEPFRSSLSGLLVMAAWSSLALSGAILVAPPDVGPARRRLDRLTPLAVLLAIWALLHLLQFLILRSAGLPEAADWYGARGGGEGGALVLYAGAVVLLAAALAWKPGENRTRLLAALALAAQGSALAWLVTPSLRGAFRLTAVDLLTLAGVAGLALALLPLARRLFPGLPAPGAGRRGAAARSHA